jgi:hypothetical protein
MTPRLKAPQIAAALPQFTGTEHYYRHQGNIVLTDGAKFLADAAGCYWLYDIVWSVLPRIRRHPFVAVKLTVSLEKRTAVVVLEDGNDRLLYRQPIPFTDFPLPEIMLFLEDGEVGGKPAKVLLLPSEH